MENGNETKEENETRDEVADTFPAIEEVAGNGEGNSGESLHVNQLEYQKEHQYG